MLIFFTKIKLDSLILYFTFEFSSCDFMSIIYHLKAISLNNLIFEKDYVNNKNN